MLKHDEYLEKAASFPRMSTRQKKKWYFKHFPVYKTRLKIRRLVRLLLKPKKLPKHVDLLRWMLVDFLRAKQKRFWGIYQFVALPGEGKTLSMVAHMERCREQRPDLLIGTNFNYAHQDVQIDHWLDMIKLADEARKQKRSCIIALDEIHVTFDSSNWQSFPPEMLALLSFNRKISLQFLCSSQIYERIPKKVRDIANYTIICKNVLGADRLFTNYYYEKDDYESMFAGTKKKAKFIREFVASDELYSLYDTLEQIDNMKLKASEEKNKREEAFQILFGGANDDDNNAA